MSRRPCIFRQTDLTRALKGARAAGMEIGRIEINKDGVITILPGKPLDPTSPDPESNEWDDGV